MDITLNTDNLPKCLNCGRVMIAEGYPRALMAALHESLAGEVTYVQTPYYCITCFTPRGWVALYENGEAAPDRLPPPNTLVQIREQAFGYEFGLRVGDHFLAIDLEHGITTTNCHITHWRAVEAVEFVEG